MRNRSRAATIIRALLALTVLVAIVAGVPCVLLAIGVLPDHVPGIGESTTALTSPDTGQLFLGAVTLIGWYGWLTFVISVVLETVAALRHRRVPRIRMLGGSQQLAGALIGGILILLPTGTAFATPATAAPLSSATVATASVTAGSHTAAKAATAGSWDGPVHRVQDGDTLWDIAEKRLGAGIEWHRIVEANKNVAQADGSVITADTTLLQTGWVLRLPTDAAPAADNDGGKRPQTGATAHEATHTVRPGETLSAIAEDELGNADDYPQIVDANKGVAQADGRTLGDPDDIYPGWQLKLPAAGSGQRDSGTAVPPQERQPAPEHDHAGEQPGTGRHDQAQPPAHAGGGKAEGPGQDGSGKDAGTEQPGGGQATARPEAPAEQPPAQPHGPDEASGHPATGAPAEQAQQDTSEDSGQSVTAVAAAGSILAAAVLGVIAVRRTRQQRRRRAKRRIPMPSGPSADFEKQLRTVSDITGTALADLALRTLAFNCHEAGRPLPEVEAIRITTRGLELHLAAATPPVAPFTERDDNPAVWWCPRRGAALLGEEQAADVTPPYPALVSLGETEEGDAVLVDLENIGLLRLAGSPADVRAVTLALAIELASSKLAGDTQIVLAGAGSDLHHLYPDQVEHHTNLAEAAAALKAHDAFQRDALAETGHDHLRSARLDDETSGDSWIPRILVATTPPTGSPTAVLEDLLTSRPRTSVAVVTAAGGELDLPGTWTLPAQPGALVELPGLDLAVKLQYLDDGAYDRLVQLLATSSRTDDVPPPAWTGHTGPADNGPRATAGPAEEASALAPEASALAADTYAPAHTASPGGDLAAALPDFTSLAPAFTADTAATAGGTSGPAEEDGASALSPAVAGPPARQTPQTYADSAGVERGIPHSGAVEPEHDADEAPYEEEPEDEEASALGAEVWDSPTAADKFDTALGEVLAEQDDEETDDTGDTGDGEADGPGMSAAALGADTDTGVDRPAPAERRIVPRPSAATSTVLAALATPPAPPTAPQVQVLGPVSLVGACGRVGSNRRSSLVEIAAWLVLHPGLSRKDLDEAIWPGMRIIAESRNTAISRLRSWIGTAPHLPADGPQDAYLPPIKGGIYAFSDQVTSDWGQFQELYQQGMHHDGPDADIALAEALALVRGRPFADVDPSKYIWAEADIQEMISAIVDVAHELAERRRQVRDYRAAAQAVTKGMLVDAQSELLYRDLFTICHEMGDREGLERAAAQLARINAVEGIDSSPETVGLLRTLLKGERTQPPTWGSAAS
ncbi:LysM peptidoglycan-binding domain-containing protein [Streptomyces sp. NPDC050485]|uniref:LysM peptidoglycan-binding domain-containing protein n=1 Tax=Streptomyces sp. NPDC050485 TaxID=3365617 RepID=UPI003791D2E8